MRLPLFVFLQRQFLQPRSEHEERLSFRSDCRVAKQQGVRSAHAADRERGLARTLRGESKHGHEENEYNGSS